MKLNIYYNERKVYSISDALRKVLEERVEPQLVEALAPFDKELSAYKYSINIAVSEDYQSIIILMEGLSDELTKLTEAAIVKVLSYQPSLANVG